MMYQMMGYGSGMGFLGWGMMLGMLIIGVLLIVLMTLGIMWMIKEIAKK
ncbi:MAG: hypothetical protein NVSMB66_1410 [Candidatus Doudnabacteria bacterium]